MISLIIPACNEEENIGPTAQRIHEVLSGAGIPYELIFVDDGSGDLTWTRILAQSQRDSRVKGLRLSRNFGKEAGIFAGLRAAGGDCCVVMDCDLQHPPETIPEMYRLWKEEGYEVVEGVKRAPERKNFLRRGLNAVFYKVLSACLGFDMEASSDFKLLDRKVRDILCAMPERETFFRALTFWVGFRTARVTYDVGARSLGKTKWTPRQLVRYAVRNVTSFSGAPLYFVAWMGAFLLVFAVVLGVQTLVKWLSGTAVEGFTTVILLLLIIGGGLMVALGIIGYYIARIYTEIKGRPRYIVEKTCGGLDQPEK